MTIPTLHVPQKDSPQSALAAGINDTETVLTLNDSSIFEADNITRLTIGIDQSATEVITISSYNGNNEITVVRGTPAYSWPLGTLVARVLNADDITEIHQHLEYLHTTPVTNGNSHDHSGGDGAVIPEGGIATGAVTADKIATGAVTADKIGTGAVTSSKLVSDAVDGSKIADNSINSEHIYAGAIDTIHIANEQITALKLATGAVSELKLSFDLPKIVEGRLTLQSGAPISLSDQADKTMLYYTPYIGNIIALYDGSSAWSLVTFAELSLNISGFAKDKPYDIFCYNNSGTATLEGLMWTSAKTRATALTRQDGVLVKTGATTRRYLGTIYMNSSNKCDDTRINRNVWNMYNRVPRHLFVYNTDEHTWSGAEGRQWNGSFNSNKLGFVIGERQTIIGQGTVKMKTSSQGNPAAAFIQLIHITNTYLTALLENYTTQYSTSSVVGLRDIDPCYGYISMCEYATVNSTFSSFEMSAIING